MITMYHLELTPKSYELYSTINFIRSKFTRVINFFTFSGESIIFWDRKSFNATCLGFPSSVGVFDYISLKFNFPHFFSKTKRNPPEVKSGLSGRKCLLLRFKSRDKSCITFVFLLKVRRDRS
jgi:hypothetical protein